MFVDEVRIHVRGGRGGNGVTSFARQPFEPRGRPDGGDGGHGGSIMLRADHDVATLLDYHHRPHRKAPDGRHGEGDLRRGADGDDQVLAVPIGTVVVAEDGALLGDLLTDRAEVVAARGGRGGRGNAAFRSGNRRAPRFHELGEPPDERWVRLELKLVADVALVGFPNAGKSSLIARLSAAKPKIADYPFTTLAPNLGVVRAGDTDFVAADVPGLIAGASEGRGLGHRFLRHVERAGAIVHVLDCASHELRDPREDLVTVVEELRRYERQVELPDGMPPLTERPAVVWLNKVDADADTAEIVRPDLERGGWEVLEGSAATGAGLDTLRHRLGALVAETRAARQAPVDAGAVRPVLRPARERGTRFTVARTDHGFAVHGDRVERWVQMTDLANDEAVRYLQGRLARAGVERALVHAGARAGDSVEMGGFVFDFSPEPSDLPAEELDRLDDRDGLDDGDHPDELARSLEPDDTDAEDDR
ncbi:MAG: GTPase ObgE [Euzebyales bacterium]|nr:GTPase ObgE [Euzebyales bacterium]